MLEDLLEQEKREQEKQQSVAAGPASGETGAGEMMSASSAPATSLLSDTEFERLRAEVLATGTQKSNVVASPPHPLLSGNHTHV